MNNDPKMDVLFTCYDALKSLQTADRKWVISQLASRLEITNTVGVSIKPPALDEEKRVATEKPNDTAAEADEGFAEAFVRVNPQTEDKKVLFAAWLLFGRNGVKDFKGSQITKKLELSGHGINSVSVCLGRLKVLRPAHVVQVGSTGKSRQSRKIYRLTAPGVKAAQQMLESAGEQ